MPFQLIDSPAPEELQQFAEELLSAVTTGEITGLGVIVILKGRRVFVDVFGSMHRYPHESRGFVAELDDCLRAIGRKLMDKHTTQ